MSNTFETTDPELAVHLLHGSYGDRVRLIPRGGYGRIRVDQAPLTRAVRLDQLGCACSLDAQTSPLGFLLVTHVRSGQVGFRGAGGERRYGAGDVCLAVQPDEATAARCAALDMAAAVIDPALLGRVAGIAPGRSTKSVSLTGYHPVSARAAELWKATWAYVREEILDVRQAAAEPLLMSTAERLLAAVTLATFPNNALTDPTSEDSHDAHPATLRRAVAFIDDNAHLQITTADIASAADVTVRAVQLAFRRHLDTTPLAYLRRVRLEKAHRELLAADPAHTTVTEVAYRWGFASASRFAAQYRAAYGVMPSRTLRR